MSITIYPPPPVEVLPFSPIKSIQRGYASVPNSTSYTEIYISPIDLAKTTLNIIGSTVDQQEDTKHLSGYMSSATSFMVVCLNDGSLDNLISWEVIEYI